MLYAVCYSIVEVFTVSCATATILFALAKDDMMKRPDFLELSQKYPQLQECVKSAASTSSGTYVGLDWKDDKTQRILTAVILKDGFGINIDLPSDRLCPPVPNRVRYIEWVRKLLDLCPPSKQAGDRVSTAALTKEVMILPTSIEFSSIEKSHFDVIPDCPNGSSNGNSNSSGCSSSSSSSRGDRTHNAVAGADHHVLDIGVGASCIYPLLGHQKYKWR